MPPFDFKREVPAAFPVLDKQQIDAVAEVAQRKTYGDGQVLFRAGETGFAFQVIKSGAIEIIDRSGGEPRVMLVHGPGEFTGDLANLSGRTSHVDARAKGDTEVYEVSPSDLQHILARRPGLSDLILQTFILRARALAESESFTGLRVIGSRFSPDTFRVREFLSKNHVLYTFLDADTDADVREILARFSVTPESLPVVGYGDDWLLRNPSTEELAERIGIKRAISADRVFDLAVIGAGPAGLAAAVYAASEGLQTVVVDQVAIGGQAGTSSRIENYLGFPLGLSGVELAGRAAIQAEKFGVAMSIPSRVASLSREGGQHIIEFDNATSLRSRALLIASGADYRRLDVPGRERFDGAGVYYAATPMEAQTCGGDQVVVIGAGNSAGQGAVFMSQAARRVYLLARGADLASTMSSYLVERIERTPNITLMTHTEVVGLHGGTHVEQVEISNRTTGETGRLRVAGVFSFIGAVPRTNWLPDAIERDSKGFIKTGPHVTRSRWTSDREPFFLETSSPGVFAAGDVRSASVKRVASAVGEGSMAVHFVHEYLRISDDSQGR